MVTLTQEIAAIIGIVALVLGATVQIPQIIRTLRTLEFKGLAIGTYLIHFTSSILWLTYGSLRRDYILCAGSVLGVFYDTLILFAYTYKRTRKIGQCHSVPAAIPTT